MAMYIRNEYKRRQIKDGIYQALQEDVMAKGINATASCDFGFLECVLSQADKQFNPSHSKSCAPFRSTK